MLGTGGNSDWKSANFSLITFITFVVHVFKQIINIKGLFNSISVNFNNL